MLAFKFDPPRLYQTVLNVCSRQQSKGSLHGNPKKSFSD